MDSLPEKIGVLRDRKVELDECNNNSQNESHLLSRAVSALGDEALTVVTVQTKGGDAERVSGFDGRKEKSRSPSAGSVRSAKSSGVTWNESVVEHSVQSTTRYSKDEDVLRPRYTGGFLPTSSAITQHQNAEEFLLTACVGFVFFCRSFFSIVLSCIYGVFVFTMGSTFCVTDRVLDEFHAPEIFSIVIASVGMSWLALFHVDILWYKHSASRQVRSKVRPSQSGLYVHSAASVFSTYARKTPAPQLWFLSGRHSGSFYLKGGMVVFCFCHLVNEGLLLQRSIQALLWRGCNAKDVLNIVFHVQRPTYSFYQLFMAFKYSNIVINHSTGLARFGLMHMIGTCLHFWFSSIVQEYRHNTHYGDDNGYLAVANETAYKSLGNDSITNGGPMFNTIAITPYLHPFTIEYNIILAGVWFIVWQNVGTEPSHHFARRESVSESSAEQQHDASYHSNLVVSADCHAANKGLFAGIFLLLTAIVSLVIGQVAFSGPDFDGVESIIFLVQDTGLIVVSLLAVVWGYVEISKLDFNVHPITLLDDVLLYVPLPFYFVYYIMSVTADVWHWNFTSVVSHLLTVAQVVLQTIFLSDGLRRCSNARRHRFTKPGREMVTFLIICNVTIWVTNTFNMEKYHLNQYVRLCFGDDAWVMVKHATFPLMLFYRFHASVCLADIWKSAYESGD
nr:proton channel OtopLc-like [Dermacentor andersoni]